MASQQTSFRDIFQFQETGKSINGLKLSNSKTQSREKQKKPNFYSIVQKAKHVALFTQTLKQRVAENQTLSNNTLKQTQLYFLQNQSKDQTLQTYFAHDNKLLFGFDIFFGLTILLYCWSCTFQIIFGQNQNHKQIAICTFIIYIIHILLFTMTQFKDKKQDLISDRKEVINYYIKQKAVKDVIVLISLLITLIEFGQSLKGLFIIFRIISLACYSEFNQIFRKIQNQIEVSIQTQSVISMVKLLYKILVFLHFLSILLNLIAIIENKSGQANTWLTSEKNDLHYNGNFQKYIIGWYWSATILSTVGFGQIVPANNLQRFIMSIIQILCCMTFGYFVNMIGSLIKLRNEPEQKYQKQLRSLNRCLNNMNPTNELKHKIRNHYFNMHVIQSIHNPKEQNQVLQNLSTQIKNGLIQENNIGFFQKCQVMKKFTRQTLINLTHKLKKIILAPQTILYSRNKKEFKLWFIKNGTVEELTDGFSDLKVKKVISVYNEKDPVVGLVNFFTQNIYKTIAKSKQFALLYELDQSDFFEVIKQNIKDYYNFLTIKQTFFQKKKKYTNKCLSCDRYTHNVINCPRIHYVRKDAKKLAIKHKNLTKFVLQEMRLKKKINRSLIRFNWKFNFGNCQLQEEAQNFMNNNDSSLKTTQNGLGIQNLFKMVHKDTLHELNKHNMSKNSFCLSKKVSSSKQLDIKELINNYQSFKLLSDDSSQFDQVFDKILLDDQTKQYMPAHNIQEVLLNYNKQSQKKINSESKLKKFKYTFQKSK